MKTFDDSKFYQDTKDEAISVMKKSWHHTSSRFNATERNTHTSRRSG